MSDEKDYQITLRIDPLFKCWTYSITTPDGRTLVDPLGGFSVNKGGAEERALRCVEIDRATETVSGADLIARRNVAGETQP